MPAPPINHNPSEIDYFSNLPERFPLYVSCWRLNTSLLCPPGIITASWSEASLAGPLSCSSLFCVSRNKDNDINPIQPMYFYKKNSMNNSWGLRSLFSIMISFLFPIFPIDNHLSFWNFRLAFCEGEKYCPVSITLYWVFYITQKGTIIKAGERQGRAPEQASDCILRAPNPLDSSTHDQTFYQDSPPPNQSGPQVFCPPCSALSPALTIIRTYLIIVKMKSQELVRNNMEWRDKNNIHLMCAPEGNSEFCFPESLNVSRDEVEGNIETRCRCI